MLSGAEYVNSYEEVLKYIFKVLFLQTITSRGGGQDLGLLLFNSGLKFTEIQTENSNFLQEAGIESFKDVLC